MKLHLEEFRIRYSDCDRYGRLKLHTVFDYAQEIAGNHATLLGFGDQFREERRLAWILSRMKLRIREYPTSETKVTVATWASGYNRAFATREFRFMTGAENRVFAEGTSYWLLLGIETGRLAIASREMSEIPLDYADAEHIFPELGKLPGCPDAPVIGEFNIYEHQIDVNCHLNNTEYASLVQDALGPGVYPAELQINYQRAVPPQSKLLIRGTSDEHSFSLAGYLDDAESFTVTGRF